MQGPLGRSALCLPAPTQPGLSQGPWDSGRARGQAANLLTSSLPQRGDSRAPGRRHAALPAEVEIEQKQPAGSLGWCVSKWAAVPGPHRVYGARLLLWGPGPLGLGRLGGGGGGAYLGKQGPGGAGSCPSHAPNDSFWQRCPGLCPHVSLSRQACPRLHSTHAQAPLLPETFTAHSVPSASASSGGCDENQWTERQAASRGRPCPQMPVRLFFQCLLRLQVVKCLGTGGPFGQTVESPTSGEGRCLSPDPDSRASRGIQA